jgi:hypothetical protein
MSKLVSLFALLFVPVVYSQTPAVVPANPTQTALYQAMTGEWTGVLEYRDYSEPATSMKRVFLPTWLSVKAIPGGLARHFVYDDGPNKVVDETDTVVADVLAGTYFEQDTGKPAQVEHVAGYDALKDGRGDLVLTGTGTDNDKLTETRTTLTVRRNLVSWVLEVRPAGSSEAFSFRHRFTFTRASVPAVTTK